MLVPTLFPFLNKHLAYVSLLLQERVDRIKALPSAASEFRLSRFPLQTVYDFSCVWKDQAVQSAYEHALRNPDAGVLGRPQ